MIFENENIAVSVTDTMVLRHEKSVSIYNSGRSFHALSYRKRSDAVLCAKNKYFSAGSNSVAFVPAQIDYTRTATYEDIYAVHFELYGYTPENIEICTPKNYSEIESLFDEICTIWALKKPGYRFKCSEKLMRIFSKIYISEYTGNIGLAQQAMHIIEREYANQNFSVSCISKKLGISDVYLRTAFNTEYGMPPKQYLTQCRMEHAFALAETGCLKVKDISEKCGYYNEKYFSTVFKNYFGFPPIYYTKLSKITQ